MNRPRGWKKIYERVDKTYYSCQIICLALEENRYMFDSQRLPKKMKVIIRAMGLYPEGKGLVTEHEPGLTVHLPLRGENIFKAHTWLEFNFVIFDLMLDIPINHGHLLALFCRVFELDIEEVHIRVPEYKIFEFDINS